MWQPWEKGFPCSLAWVQDSGEIRMGKEVSPPGIKASHSHSLSIYILSPSSRNGWSVPPIYIASSQGLSLSSPMMGQSRATQSCSPSPVLKASIQPSLGFLRVPTVSKRWRSWKVVQLLPQQLHTCLTQTLQVRRMGISADDRALINTQHLKIHPLPRRTMVLGVSAQDLSGECRGTIGFYGA